MSRVVSAAVLVAILATVIWRLDWWATTLFAAIAAGIAGAELAALGQRVGAPMPPLVLGVAAAICAASFGTHETAAMIPGAAALPGVLLAVILAAGLLALSAGPPAPTTITAAAIAVLAPLYAGLPLGAAAWIRTVAGPGALTWLVAVIASSDSAQYYTGRAFGRRKLAPLVSPAKTVEGAIGGVVIAAIVGGVLGRFWLPAIGAGTCALLALGLAAAGIVGDLFESLLKRSAGVKDSSHLIPGHGGMLDRVDSYLFAAPLYYTFLRYIA